MLHRTYDSQVCSAARTLEIVGERWTLLIVRDALLGYRRFEDFQRNLGIARNVLTDRLGRLVEAGVLERRSYSERPPRDEYRLTQKGRDLWPVIHSLVTWGDEYEAPNGPPRAFTHRDCGGTVTDRRVCDRCGAELEVRDCGGTVSDRRVCDRCGAELEVRDVQTEITPAGLASR